MSNQLKTTFLLALLTVFIVLVGRLLGGQQGMILAFLLAAGMNFFSYWFSDKVVLRMYRAREITREQAPEVYDIVASLAQRAGLPMPKVCIIPQETPNAFATGRNPEHAVVAVTEGLLRLMDREEITGVLAHEMAHVKNRDILIGSIAATMAGAVMILANMARWSAIFGGVNRNDQQGGGLGMIGLLVTLDPRADGRHGDPDGGFALARVPGRRHWRRIFRQSRGAGAGSGKTRRLLQATADAGRPPPPRT